MNDTLKIILQSALAVIGLLLSAIGSMLVWFIVQLHVEVKEFRKETAECMRLLESNKESIEILFGGEPFRRKPDVAPTERPVH